MFVKSLYFLAFIALFSFLVLQWTYTNSFTSLIPISMQYDKKPMDLLSPNTKEMIMTTNMLLSTTKDPSDSEDLLSQGEIKTTSTTTKKQLTSTKAPNQFVDSLSTTVQTAPTTSTAKPLTPTKDAKKSVEKFSTTEQTASTTSTAKPLTPTKDAKKSVEKSSTKVQSTTSTMSKQLTKDLQKPAEFLSPTIKTTSTTTTIKPNTFTKDTQKNAVTTSKPVVPPTKVIFCGTRGTNKFPIEVYSKNNWHCHFTQNVTLFSKADAYLLTFPYFRDEALNVTRPKNQKWIFYSEEPALRFVYPLTLYNGHFNITQTYRRDSDVVYNYGRLIERNPPIKLDKKNHAQGKTKMVAWFVSHCSELVETSSRRMAYAKALQKYIPVDIYGRCGNLTCKNDANRSCEHMLERDYKFYLSFENCVCKDYVTEKFYTYVNFIVPIVLGGVNYHKLLPNKMFIHVQDFNTPKDLADYLIKLDKNDTLYNEYFQWKEKYKVHYGGGAWLHPLCDYLYENENMKGKVYEDIEGWWGPKRNCLKPEQYFSIDTTKALDEIHVTPM